ncbi:hypothetical protein M153_2460005218 [Pseudoloma neurophilia]|uniref:Uncharacterized protein n=1 Tax=Pseudoloma neurophilia TaxID=146866 RepID=A0A0R0LYU9_9MICR|nr:hypothetical protein M153_2460005218 [Pseudoloma neurophilia]
MTSSARNRLFKKILIISIAIICVVSFIAIAWFVLRKTPVKSHKHQNNEMNVIKTYPCDFFFWLQDYFIPLYKKPGVILTLFMKTKSANGNFLTCLVDKNESDGFKYLTELLIRPDREHFDFLKKNFLSKRKSDLLSFRYKPELRNPYETRLISKNPSKVEVIPKEENIRFREFLKSFQPDIEKHKFLLIYREIYEIGVLPFNSPAEICKLMAEGRIQKVAKTDKFDNVAVLLALFVQDNRIDSSAEDLIPVLSHNGA